MWMNRPFFNYLKLSTKSNFKKFSIFIPLQDFVKDNMPLMWLFTFYMQGFEMVLGISRLMETPMIPCTQSIEKVGTQRVKETQARQCWWLEHKKAKYAFFDIDIVLILCERTLTICQGLAFSPTFFLSFFLLCSFNPMHFLTSLSHGYFLELWNPVMDAVRSMMYIE